MTSTIRNRKTARDWQEKFNASAPRVGDKAPDFILCDHFGKNPIQLSMFRGQKPVALIFGSFT